MNKSLSFYYNITQEVFNQTQNHCSTIYGPGTNPRIRKAQYFGNFLRQTKKYSQRKLSNELTERKKTQKSLRFCLREKIDL